MGLPVVESYLEAVAKIGGRIRKLADGFVLIKFALVKRWGYWRASEAGESM